MTNEPGPDTPFLVGDAVRAAPGDALAILESFGIKLDPFTVLAMECTPEQLAEYSALRDAAPLQAALQVLLKRGDPRGTRAEAHGTRLSPA